MISEEYRRLNAQLHETRPDYGALGHIWAERVANLAAAWNCQTAVDFGCGKGTFKEAMRRISPVRVTNYDPSIPEFDVDLAPVDLIVCTDVLEHIEPDHLHDVLSRIQLLANVGAFLNIACRPAKKTLPDGRNAHLIVREPYFWLDTMREYFDIELFEPAKGAVTLVCKRLGTGAAAWN